MRLLAPLLALGLASCAAQASPAPEMAQRAATVETVTASELAAMIERGEVVLVDVRTPAEFEEGRLNGALNAPIQTFVPASIPIEAERETILYCRSSGRSGRAAQMLAEHTGGTVRHLEGGIIAWQEAGLPVVRAPEEN